MKNILIVRCTQKAINRCEVVIRTELDLSKFKDTHGIMLVAQDKTERTLTKNTNCVSLSWALLHKLEKKNDKQFIKLEWYSEDMEAVLWKELPDDMEAFLRTELPDDLVAHIENNKDTSFWDFEKEDFEGGKHFETEISCPEGDIAEVFAEPVVRNMLVITRPLELLEKVNYPDITLSESELHKLRHTHGLLLASPELNTNDCEWNVFHVPEASILTNASTSISFCQSQKERCRVDRLPADFFAAVTKCNTESFFYAMPEPVTCMRDFATTFEGDAEIIPQDQSPLYMYSVETILDHLSARLNSKITITR